MSTSLFNLGLSGLNAAQASLRTAGHNVANANTPGFSRQSVSVASRTPQGSGLGFIGRGVTVTTTTREFDGFVEGELLTTGTAFARADKLHALASQVDNLLGSSGGGLAPALDGFFDALGDVAADPSSAAGRQVLLGEADSLVSRFHTLEQRFEDLNTSLNAGLGDVVEDVNAIATNIASINRQIVRELGAFSDQPPNDLLDARDQLVRDLSARLDVSTISQDDGSLNVFVGSGQGLVVGSQAASLTLVQGQVDPSRAEVAMETGGAVVEISQFIRGGEIAGQLEFRDRVLEPAARQLGHVALGLAQTMNRQHALGQTLTGAAGGQFFASIDDSATVVRGRTGNLGDASISVGVSDVSAVGDSDFLLEREGAVHRLTRQSDGRQFTFTDFPGDAEELVGLRFTLDSGTIADGDQYLIQPTRFAARNLSLVIRDPGAIAAATPVRASVPLSNVGNAALTDLSVNSPQSQLELTFSSPTAFSVVDLEAGTTLATNVPYTASGTISFNGIDFAIAGAPAAGDTFTVSNTVTASGAANAGTGDVGLASVVGRDPNLTDTVTLTFTSATTFDVAGSTAGLPVTNVAYTPGASISFNGWTGTLSGTPVVGDTITIGANTGGVGDNGNVRALAGLQDDGVLDGGRTSLAGAYSELVADVGTHTRQADIERTARSTLFEQISAERESRVGVNLDEEAANLLRFQQAFQASARLIAVADELFDSLLSAVGR